MENAAPDARRTWREQQSDFRARLQRPIADRQSLLDLLLAPLDLLGLVPHDHLNKFGVVKDDYWKRLRLGDANSNDAIAQYRWIGDVQLILLRTVLPDWRDAFEDDELYELILQQWIAPARSGTTAEVTSLGAVRLCALHSFTLLLSELAHGESEQEGQSSRRRETLKIVESALEHFFSGLSLGTLSQFCQMVPSSTQKELVWQDAMRELVSLPDRIANVFQGQIPKHFESERIRSLVATQLEELVASDQKSQEHAKALLVQMKKAGWLHVLPDWTIHSNSIWPSLLFAISKRVRDGGFSMEYSYKWRDTIVLLSESDRSAVIVALVSALDQHCLKPSGFANLRNNTEVIRPGAEGMAFLSEEAWTNSLRIGAMLDMLMTMTEQDTDEEESLNALLVQVILPTNVGPTRSPLMARLLVHIVLQKEQADDMLGEMLLSAIRMWSEQARSVSIEEEVYLSTIVILLLHSLPSTHECIARLSTSVEFIKGVSSHLEHLSPHIRRSGMLLAELVSERSGKSMSFGKRAWEGRGDGKEEARVLRALALQFSVRRKGVVFTTEQLLSALRLEQKETDTSHSLALQPKKERVPSEPISRRLPERKQAPTKRMLIEEVDDHNGHAGLPSLSDISGEKTRPKVVMLSDDEESSSDDEDNSSSDDEQSKEANSAPAQEEGKAFGMGAPSKGNKIRAPVYIGELAPMLRQNERDSVRMGLKQARTLIARKTGWGGEVDENAIDLCLALCALQNNFGIKDFDRLRLGALTALTVSTPQLVAPCLAEQYFVHQYSMTQRIAMLNALAFGASELATGVKEEDKVLDKRNAASLALDFAQMAMSNARKEGEERMPEIQRERALMVDAQPQRASNGASLSRRTDAALARKENKYTAVATASFIFPLVNRLWTHIQRINTSTVRQNAYAGAGQSIIDMPFMIGALFDTLAVLCHHAQNESHFRSDVVGEVIQLVLTFTRPILREFASTVGVQLDEKAEGGGRSTILGSAAALLLVVLDASWQVDFGAFLCRQNARFVADVQIWANALFEAANGGSNDRSFGVLDRTGRASAAILLRINEMQERQKARTQ